MIIHGEKDSTISIRHSHLLYDKYVLSINIYLFKRTKTIKTYGLFNYQIRDIMICRE